MAILALLIAACSGVPTSSAPQVIGPAAGVPVEPARPAITPQPGAEPRAIVQEFLRANATEPTDHGAQAFLTAQEQRTWSERTVTILAGSVANAIIDIEPTTDPPHAVGIKVTGTQIGSIAADGTYSPAPPGSGGVGQSWSYVYGLDKVNGQWRIGDAPQRGLVIYADEFTQEYRAVPVYFYDQAERHLVPDVRYTALQSPQDVASWQLQRLLGGPSNDLGDALHSDLPNPPAGTNPSVNVDADGSLSIEVPGSSHLDAGTQKRLAAQLIMSFADSQSQLAITITDSGTPVDIPGFPPRFTEATLAQDPVTAPLFASVNPMQLFYLDAEHRLVSGADGEPVSGPLGSAGRYDLTSVAVARDDAKDASDDDVAATIGTGTAQTFWIGQLSTGLVRTGVPRGQLTRPSWAPGLEEAWVAEGARLFRVNLTDPAQPTVVPTALPHGDRITALRLSPDGSRLAMIVRGPDGSAQLWVGAVVRAGSTGDGSVHLASPEPITSPQYHLNDVAWDDNMTLWVIGTDDQQQRDHGIWSVTVDGANLQSRTSAGLPQGADAITTGLDVLPWVSVGGHVFVLGSDWEGPDDRITLGTAPVYLE